MYELRDVVPTGVVPLPIAACTANDPAPAVNETVALAFVLATSIVPVVVRLDAFGAVKLKLLPAPDAAFIATAPLFESDM